MENRIFRCPDSHDPYDVFYDKNKDALDPFLVEARVLRTDEGLVHLSGCLLNLFFILFFIRTKDLKYC